MKKNNYIIFLALIFITPKVLADYEPVPNMHLADAQYINFVETPFELSISSEQAGDNDSFKIQPGQGLVFQIPARYASMKVDQVVLAHRQSPMDDRSHVRSILDKDKTPGLTALLFFDPNFRPGEKWRHWLGPASGKWGAKFAEVRTRDIPELELLYAFGHYGTSSLQRTKSHDLISPTYVSVVNIGTDPVLVQKIQIRYLPPEPNFVIEKIISPATQFDAFTKGRATHYGGGENRQGTYPYAWSLSRSRNIIVDLPSGVKLSAVDVLCGDAQGWSSGRYVPGNGFLNIRWLRHGQPYQTLLSHENVGAQSMLRGIPEEIDALTEDGDQIEISSDANKVYVMAYRLALRKP